jgi:hypothetical protein
MSESWVSGASTDGVHGFILVHETLCDGLIPAERDGANRPVLYGTRAQAELELFDAAEQRADSMREAQMEPEDDDRWVETAVLHADGGLTLVDQDRTFTADALRELLG